MRRRCVVAEDEYRPSWVSDFPCPRCGTLMRHRGSFTCEVYTVFHVLCGKCGVHEDVVQSHVNETFVEEVSDTPVSIPGDSKVARWVKPSGTPKGRWAPGKNRARRRK